MAICKKNNKIILIHRSQHFIWNCFYCIFQSEEVIQVSTLKQCDKGITVFDLELLIYFRFSGIGNIKGLWFLKECNSTICPTVFCQENLYIEQASCMQRILRRRVTLRNHNPLVTYMYSSTSHHVLEFALCRVTYTESVARIFFPHRNIRLLIITSWVKASTLLE